MALRKLPRSFYLRPAIRVARELLGCFLVRRSGKERCVGRIVEVEAYLGSRDPASHAFRGRTKRNEVMFHRGGHLYVYFTYGMHFCANVVTGAEGTPHAVLLRAVEPVEGIEGMRRRRKLPKHTETVRIANGPAKLCAAFGIGRSENGTDLLGRHLWIAADEGAAPAGRIASSPRIGISRGREHRWRFFCSNNPCVSPGKPSAEIGAATDPALF